MKTKTSQSLLPDEKLMLQTFKRILYEVYYWSRVVEATISDILLQDNGWIIGYENDEVHPLWLTGMFLTSCLHFTFSSFKKNWQKNIFLVLFLKR